MPKRDIPANLKDLQSEKRFTTIKKIQDAINEIQQDGGIVTKKKLMELTGLSSSTFSKDHVIEILKLNRVCQFRNVNKRGKVSDSNLDENLYKKIEKLERQNMLLQSKLQDKDIVIGKLQNDYKELEQSYSILLGKIHLIMKKVDQYDVDIGIDFDNM